MKNEKEADSTLLEQYKEELSHLTPQEKEELWDQALAETSEDAHEELKKRVRIVKAIKNI